MQRIQNFQEVEQVLLQYVRPADEPGGYTLERMQKLMKFLGDPQNQLKIIHVAGTSGKTSTCYYAAAQLRAAGFSVGHTVSPHVSLIAERAQINLELLPEKSYCEAMTRFLDLIETSRIQPSYFELLVAFAYWLFAEHKVDYVVVEVGLGGSLDGTNVVNRSDKVCVITDIGHDHTQILGTTVTQIAAHKAGIIYSYNQVFMNAQAFEIEQVVRDKCLEQQAEVTVLEPQADMALIHDLPLFQQRNWQLAVTAVNYTLQRDGYPPLNAQQMAQTLTTYIPARMEIINLRDKLIILDGSHNEQKITALTASIRQKFPKQSFVVLVAFGENKLETVQASLELLSQLGEKIILTEFKLGQDHVRRAIPADELKGYAEIAGFSHTIVLPDPAEAVAEAMKQTETHILFTGSFYLFNHIRPLLDGLAADSPIHNS